MDVKQSSIAPTHPFQATILYMLAASISVSRKGALGGQLEPSVLCDLVNLAAVFSESIDFVTVTT